ncbi:MAG: hypothetical protein P8J26_06320 [Pseudomonadales bacterium]|nr:hypothetical protein [Pseudomonadales bacterium]
MPFCVECHYATTASLAVGVFIKINEESYMSQRNVKPVSVTLGAAFLATAITAGANAEATPFSAQPLPTGYDILHFGAEGKCGEGKCGEGACGGASGSEESKGDEGKCGEGKCGEGKCGG